MKEDYDSPTIYDRDLPEPIYGPLPRSRAGNPGFSLYFQKYLPRSWVSCSISKILDPVDL